MNGALGSFTLLLVSLGAAYGGYSWWLHRGLKTRVVSTAVPPEQLRLVFAHHAATSGWSIVDPGNPMVAQAPALAGPPEQLALSICVGDDHRSIATIGCGRRARGSTFCRPSGALAARARLDWTVRALHAQDPSARSGIARRQRGPH